MKMTDKKIEKDMGADLKRDYGALVSITDIVKYTGMGHTTVQKVVAGCRPFGNGTGKRYFYQDVVEALMRRE